MIYTNKKGKQIYIAYPAFPKSKRKLKDYLNQDSKKEDSKNNKEK